MPVELSKVSHPRARSVTAQTLAADQPWIATVELERIISAVAAAVRTPLERRGAVVPLTPTFESATCAAVAARALGPENVLGLFASDRETLPTERSRVAALADRLRIEILMEDITPALDAMGSYARRDAAVRLLIPEFGAGWRWQLTRQDGSAPLDRSALYQLSAHSPDGRDWRVKISQSAYRAILAAQAFKERMRSVLAYYYADLRQAAVVGTLNRQRYEQGGFAKGGDGLADIEPVAHLYSSQVAALAVELGVDRGLWGDAGDGAIGDGSIAFENVLESFDAAILPSAAAMRTGLGVGQVSRLYHEFSRRRRETRYLRMPALFVSEPIDESPLDDQVDPLVGA